MAEYKIFRLNDSGVVDSANRLPFADDGAATAHARSLSHPGRVEVWAGQRRVCILPSTRVDPSAGYAG